MELLYQANGNLASGIYILTWEQFCQEFGQNSRRKELLEGLEMALGDLKKCGCKSIYIDGSFVSKKSHPNDFDACWEVIGVDLASLFKEFPIFFDFANSRENQKKKYKGEFFPSTSIAVPYPKELFIDFFQHDRDGSPKGIVKLLL